MSLASVLCLPPWYIFVFPKILTWFPESSSGLKLLKLSLEIISLSIIIDIFPPTQFFNTSSLADIANRDSSSVPALPVPHAEGGRKVQFTVVLFYMHETLSYDPVSSTTLECRNVLTVAFKSIF